MEYDKSYINKLKSEKQRLVDILNSKGVSSSNDETFTTLAPKIVAIDTGDYFRTSFESGEHFTTTTPSYTHNSIETIIKKLPPIDFSNIDFRNYTANGFRNFINCVEIGKFILPEDTTDLSNLFYDCNSLTTYDLSGVNWSNITKLEYAFYRCSSLSIIDLSNLNLENITTLQATFFGCSQATEIKLPNILMNNLTTVGSLFANCSNLTSYQLPIFPETNVICNSMFSSCSSLENIVLPSMHVNSMSGVFSRCISLISADLSNVIFDENTSSLTNLFYKCSSLKTVNFGNNIIYSKQINQLFQDCTSIEHIDFSKINSQNVTDASYTFDGCSSLKTIVFDSLDFSNARCGSMFSGCSSLNFDSNITISVNSGSSLFRDCLSLDKEVVVNITGISSYYHNSISRMFYGCTNIPKVTINLPEEAEVTSDTNPFDECTNLTDITFNFIFKPSNSLYLFRDTNNIVNIGGIFDLLNCSSISYISQKTKLEKIYFKNLKISLNLSSNININEESINYLLNNVQDVTSSPKTITLSEEVLARASADAVSHAESLGWTVTA